MLQCLINQNFHKNKAITIFDSGHLRNVCLGSNDLKFKNGRHIEIKILH